MSVRADTGVAAFDVGGTSTRCAIVDGARVHERIVRPSVRGAGLADDLGLALDELLDRAPSKIAEAVAISIPGPLSADRRSVAFTGNLELRDYPLADLLEQRTGRPIVIDDDANCAAYGEAVHGAAKGFRTSVTIVVGTGIGAGVVIDGRVYRGAHSLAGELGHMPVERNGPLCSCGRHGCLEAMANGGALLRRAGESFASPEDVFGAAARGETRAVEAVEETAYYLAVGIATAAMVVDPNCIVLTGGIGRQPMLVDAARAAARGLSVEPVDRFIDVRAGALGDDGGLVGAALLVTGNAGR